MSMSQFRTRVKQRLSSHQKIALFQKFYPKKKQIWLVQSVKIVKSERYLQKNNTVYIEKVCNIIYGKQID